MSHKTLVNGTVYEVGGGKTLIDGVAYSIDKGKTLVGGTAYEVGFAKPMISFTIRESSNIYWGTRTYQAEEGMTWGEWVDSEYNSPYTEQGYSILYMVDGDMIRNNEQGLYVCVPSDYTFLGPNDLIVADFAYGLAKD